MNVEVGVSVWLLYGGPKAEHFVGRPNDFAIKLLLDDLVKLKLPHPRRENIEFISRKHGAHGASFFWPRVPTNGVSVLNLNFTLLEVYFGCNILPDIA